MTILIVMFIDINEFKSFMTALNVNKIETRVLYFLTI